MSDKHAILGILRNHDRYGYEISKMLKDVEGFWYIFPGNVYKSLTSLEREGLVEVVRREEHEGRMRKIYGITPDGEIEFDRWITEPAELPRTRHEGYLKIWLSSGSQDKVRTQIKQILKVSGSLSKSLEGLDLENVPEYVRWLIEAGKRHVSVDVEWAESCLDALDEGTGSKGK